MTTPRMTSTTPVARLSVLGEALLANTAAMRAQTSVKSTQSANTVQSGAPPMAKCETEIRQSEERFSAGERCEGHDENTGAHGGLELVAEHGGEDEQHHHAAARADEAADKADEHAAENRLHGALFRAHAGHGLLGRHDGTDDELHAEQKGHKDREAAHRGRGDKARGVAADHGEGQHACHHDETVADVEIFAFAVGVGRHGACQHVGRERDADRHIGVHAEEGDEHGADDRRGAHASKTGAEACAHAGEKGDEKCDGKFHF